MPFAFRPQLPWLAPGLWMAILPIPSSHCPGDSQGSKLGHVVETGHRNGGDVVVVQGPERDRQTI